MHPQAGGAEVRIHELGKRLVELGHDVNLVCERWKGSSKSDTLDGIQITRVTNKFGIHFMVPFMLNRFGDYDIVVDDIAHAVPWFSPLFTRRPVVGQIHHLHQELLKSEMSIFLAKFLSLCESMVSRIYKKVIVVSESTKNDLVHKIGVSEEIIKIIPNGVDLQSFRPMDKTIMPTLLWIGRMKRYKRVNHVLLAFEAVKNEFPNAKLFVVGDGDYLETIKKTAKDLNLCDVHFLGKICEKEKIDLMASSWVVINTSLKEGWGLTVVECAACGTPTVAYDVAGLRDSIKNKVTGLLVESGNVKSLTVTIKQVLRDNDLRLKLSGNAIDYAKKFSWDKTVDELVKVVDP